MAWTTVKTDWKSTDFFNFADFNRINQNIKFLVAYTQMYKDVAHISFSTWENSDITSYDDYYRSAQFNNFEKTLNTLHGVYSLYFQMNTFYENGAFITADELNRIESACLTIYNRILELDKYEDHLGRVYSGEVYA